MLTMSHAANISKAKLSLCLTKHQMEASGQLHDPAVLPPVFTG